MREAIMGRSNEDEEANPLDELHHTTPTIGIETISLHT
jgi:hypothetical protein